jgi:glycosyltransferase involved in cell wall biosynthesis
MPRWRSYLNSLMALPTPTPLQAVYCWHPALVQRAIEIARKCNENHSFDVIHVEHLRGAKYGLRLKSYYSDLNSRIRIVWDSVDSISALFRQAAVHSKSAFGRWMSRLELRRTERYEGWLVSQFDRVLVTSSADKRSLLSQARPDIDGDKVHVLPNGVDLAYFQPDENVSRDPDTVMISGKMSYHANITMVLDFVQEIMPRVWANREEVKVWIVGKDPTPAIRSLARDPRITVTGTVDDIRPYIQRATAAVAPITYGAGIQNKVLEAMACATPVVTTPQAISSIKAKPGEDVLVEQDPGNFARALLNLLNDPQQQQRLGQAGRKYVETHHQWNSVVTQLEEIYSNLS